MVIVLTWFWVILKNYFSSSSSSSSWHSHIKDVELAGKILVGEQTWISHKLSCQSSFSFLKGQDWGLGTVPSPSHHFTWEEGDTHRTRIKACDLFVFCPPWCCKSYKEDMISFFFLTFIYSPTILILKRIFYSNEGNCSVTQESGSFFYRDFFAKN